MNELYSQNFPATVNKGYSQNFPATVNKGYSQNFPATVNKGYSQNFPPNKKGYYQNDSMYSDIKKNLPSNETVSNILDTASDAVCYVNAFYSGLVAIGLLVVTLLIAYFTSGAENLDDITGIIEEVEDSHVMEDVTVDKIEADRWNSLGTALPGTAKTMSDHIERKRPDGSVQHITKYRCNGPTLEYVKEDGKKDTLPCGERSGECSTSTAYVSTFKNGKRNCVFHTPNIHCTINNSKTPCHYKELCPKLGSTIKMARSLKDNSFSCLQGNWNSCNVKISYVSPSGKEREQTFTIPMDKPGKNSYKKGSEIPVYYSNKNMKISLSDSNMASVASSFVSLFGFITFIATLNSLSYLNKTICMVRIGLRVADKLDDKLGLDII